MKNIKVWDKLVYEWTDINFKNRISSKRFEYILVKELIWKNWLMNGKYYIDWQCTQLRKPTQEELDTKEFIL